MLRRIIIKQRRHKLHSYKFSWKISIINDPQLILKANSVIKYYRVASLINSGLNSGFDMPRT